MTISELLQKTKGAKRDDFLAKVFADRILQGYKLLVRLQVKDKEQNYYELTKIVGEIERQIGRKLNYGFINSDMDQVDEFNRYINEDMKLLVEQSAIRPRDVLFCTSIIDAGTSINYIIDENGNKTQDEKLLLCYVVDKRTCNFDNIEQFFNRARFETEKRLLLVIKNDDETIEDEKTQKERVLTFEEKKEQVVEYLDFLRNELTKLFFFKDRLLTDYQEYKKYTDKESAVADLKSRIRSGASNQSSRILSCLEFDEENETLSFNQFNMYRIVKELDYMQYFDIELIADKIKTYFEGDIVILDKIEKEEIDKIDFNKDEYRKAFFTTIKEDKKTLEAFNKKQGKEFALLTKTSYFNDFEIIARSKEYNAIDVFCESNTREIKKLARYLTIKEVETFDNYDIEELQNIIDKKNIIVIGTKRKQIENLLNGVFNEEIQRLINAGYTANEIIETVKRGREYLGYKVASEECKAINKRFTFGIKPTLQKEREQYRFIKAVQKVQDNKNSISLSDKNIDKMINELGLKKEYDEAKDKQQKKIKQNIIKQAKLIFKYKVKNENDILLIGLNV